MNQENFENLVFEALFVVKTIAEEGITDKQIEVKSDMSYVTNIDLKIEEQIKKEFKKYFSDLNFLGEEFGFENNLGRYTLIIDPIDGTQSYIETGKNYAITLALEDSEKKEIIYGAVYDVFEDILYLNNKRIGIKPKTKLESIIVQGEPTLDKKVETMFGKTGLFLPGSSTALLMARALHDEYEIFMSNSYNVKKWDVAASYAISKYIPRKKLSGINCEFNFEKPNKTGILIK